MLAISLISSYNFCHMSRNEDMEGIKSMQSGKYKTRDTVFIAMFAVLIAICSWISIPTVIPFTMQTFAVFLALNYLGAGKGTLCVCVYLLLGLLGLLVFANFTSGIGMLLGTTGGYMIGWILAGLVMGLLERLLGRKLWAQAVSMLIGLVVCYLSGTVWFMAVYAEHTGVIGMWTVLVWCVISFVVPDLVKLFLALCVSQRLKKLARQI